MTPYLSLSAMLRSHAWKTPNHPCFSDSTYHHGFLQTHQRVNQLCRGLLDAGIKRGDRIAVLSDNGVPFAELYLAACRLGAVLIPLPFRWHPQMIENTLKRCGATIFFIESIFLNRLAHPLGSDFPWIEIRKPTQSRSLQGTRSYEEWLSTFPSDDVSEQANQEDPWVMLYTSGSTGEPKGVLRSHHSYIAFFLLAALEFAFQPGDRGLFLMPLYHVNTTFFAFALTYLGASCHFLPALEFDGASCLHALKKEGISFASFIPTHYHDMIHCINNSDDSVPKVYPALKKLLCSSAPVSFQQKQEIQNVFTSASLYEAYGSTEAGMVTVLKPEEADQHHDSVGREVVGSEQIRILDEQRLPVPPGCVGELYSKSPMLFDTYDPPSGSTSFLDGYFSAGDLGYRDQQGYIHLVDRKHHRIISGGEHVYPSEVEKCLLSNPEVKLAGVVGIPHKRWGETVVAVIAVENNKLVEGYWINECKKSLAAHKVPKQILIWEASCFPLTASGKVHHQQLKELVIKAIHDSTTEHTQTT